MLAKYEPLACFSNIHESFQRKRRRAGPSFARTILVLILRSSLAPESLEPEFCRKIKKIARERSLSVRQRRASGCDSERGVSSPSASSSRPGQPGAPCGAAFHRGQRAPASHLRPRAVPRLNSANCAPPCGQAPAWITQMSRVVSGNIASYANPDAAEIGTKNMQFRPGSRQTSMHVRTSGSPPRSQRGITMLSLLPKRAVRLASACD